MAGRPTGTIGVEPVAAVPPLSYAAVAQQAQARRLMAMGAVREGNGAIVLLGPDEPGGFWHHFRASPEAQDGSNNPMDRWSKRVIGDWAEDLGAEALFPFTGPPYHPFHEWVVASGQAHASPVGLLMHVRAGLWVSYRGALRLPHLEDLPPTSPHPCDSCAGKPCLTACPVSALAGAGYDVDACKGYLASDRRCACMTGGCRVREVCPVSRTWGRLTGQSAFHMRAFLPHDA